MRNKLDIVVTMGGLGSRFREKGYRVPKYRIEAKGRTLFEWSMMSLEGFAGDAAQYIFPVLKDGETDAEGFIRQQCRKLAIRDCHVILLEELTEGQAATAKLAERYWDPEHGLLIYNIDTYVEPGQMDSSQLKGDGFLPCFRAEGDHWSFVRLDEKGKVVEIREKERISDHCTVGAYYFRTCRLYSDLYEEYYGGSRKRERTEQYVAPLYNQLLKRNGEVYITDLDPEKVHVLGTPEELETFLKE